jgi:hypothetical protein
MDSVGAAASIIALVQFTNDVIGYINSTKSAGSERKKILDEIISAHYFLLLLKDKTTDPEWTDIMKSLTVPKGPVEQFKCALERIAAIVNPEGMGKIKKFAKTAAWHFQKGEVEDILWTIERQKSLFSLAMQNDHM